MNEDRFMLMMQGGAYGTIPGSGIGMASRRFLEGVKGQMRG